jgi:arabinofuranosyltransferase
MPIMNNNKRNALIFGLVLAAFGLYAAIYIHRTSFVIEGVRHYCLFDDGMISMQFAKNLAHGHGLVFNPGEERVEGITNPLWALMMAAIHILPVGLHLTSLFVQVVALLLLGLNLYFVKKIMERLCPGSGFAILAATALTALCSPLNTWGLQGMEVSALAAVATGSLWRLMVALDERKFSPWPYLVLGAGSLLRPDGIILLGLMMLYMAAVDRENRKRIFAVSIASGLLFAGGQTLVRLWYYGDILPNTFYLKMTGYPMLVRWVAGAISYYQFVFRLNLGLVALALASTWIWPRRTAQMLLWAFVGQSAYEIHVGGDAWGWGVLASRYVTVVLPLFFCMAAYGAVNLLGALEARFAPLRKALAGGPLRLGVLGIALLSFNQIHNLEAFASWALVTPPFEVRGNQRRVEYALYLKSITRPEARIAIVYAGAIPYFAERRFVDLLGKNDPQVARLPMRRAGGVWKYIGFYPGHLKWDYAYSIGELKPDVVAQLWWFRDEAQPYLERFYHPVNSPWGIYYIRNDTQLARHGAIEG